MLKIKLQSLDFDESQCYIINMVKTKKNEFGINMEEMLKAGLHFGHRTSKLHPKMELFVCGVRNTVHIIDLERTSEKLKEALEFIKQLMREQKILLLVGTKIQHRELVENIAKEYNLPYITERWLGGTLTNFQVMEKRIEYLKEMEEKKQLGELEKYTKKERIKIDRELQNLEIKFGGIKNLERAPDAIFICDMGKDDLAVKEARIKGIPIIAIADTNVDPTSVDFPIPANDDAISSVKYILEKVAEVIKSQKSLIAKQSPTVHTQQGAKATGPKLKSQK